MVAAPAEGTAPEAVLPTLPLLYLLVSRMPPRRPMSGTVLVGLEATA